jgi:hypothetical protein
MSQDDWGKVRITIVDLEGSPETIMQGIRAAVAETNSPRPVRTFNAEVERTSDAQRPPAELPPTPTPAALPPSSTETAAPRAETTEKKRTHKKNANSGQAQLQSARKAKLDTIIKAKIFDDHERYIAAINKEGVEMEDLAALITRLAQDKFGFDEGLSPSEVIKVLKARFYINVKRRTLETAMKDAGGSFFDASPADFDHRAKLYRPMKDCITRVEKLLSECNAARITPVNSDNHREATVN